MSEKDQAIHTALDYLRHRLGEAAFVIIDHWEADLAAVGVASPTRLDRLVCISCFDQRSSQPPRYTAILERAPAPNSDLLYEECGHFAELSLEDLATVVSTHL